MDYVFQDLPLHVLLVHVVIVATPLLALALVVAGAWPAARRVLWAPCLVGAAVLVPLALVTIEAGKWLEQRVPPAPLIQEHTAQGEDIVPWVIAIAVVAAALAAWSVLELVARRRDRSIGRGAVVGASVVLTLAALVVGAGATWTIVQIGESGSRAVWEGGFSDEPLE
ncbi:hypothetical protein GE115_01910 [Agromyces sp. CFH 90414]|uniref:DUF2231 domain-containing protein n=1 Tax=Agromyces agglutinans TaxID=2662258 RepID=A0A6I2F2A5_9MICO|nr:DUF2231 domain-containing protein [Agromyces agglutinans]MRG58632.1 hypothetical protein [Agromyces agglutinans]